MKRLFLSLYVLLSLSILGIGWTLDNLWRNHVDLSPAEEAPFLALARLLTDMPPQARAHYLQRLNQHEIVPLQLMDADQVALSHNGALGTDKMFAVTLSDQREMRLVRIGNQVLMAGPLPIDGKEDLQNLFTLFFYLLLAGVALAWVWPLSRDIRILREATRAFGRAKWDTSISVSSRSPVRGLAETFNDMASHISALIDNQKHLTNAVSHEIRTPLARLKFALALLPNYCTEGSSESKRTAFLEDMHGDIKEMEQLLAELLNFASLEAAPDAVKFEQCTLPALIRQTVARLEGLSAIPILLTLPDDARIQADPVLVDRALQNLITNAQRFAKTSIRIDLLRQEEEWCLSVEDDGEGIPQEAQPKVFEPFFRVNTGDHHQQGHGLGLAIIKRIMQRHKGRVCLESRPGQTCFKLHFPVKD